MKTNTTCVAPERLRALLDDRLPEAEQAELAGHLEGCAICRGAFEEMAAGRRWWSDVRRYAPGAAGPESIPATVSLSGDTPLPEEPGAETMADEDVADFLDPPAEPGDLGRFGPYRVLGVIGRGGMGIVLRAFDPTLHRPVAIKVLAPELAAGATARRRFSREARAAASVVHDHVVTIHAVDEAKGLPYLVMHLVKGRSLQQRIDGDGPLGLAEILRIGRQAALGLAAAHEQGLVHRDIKPANILLENGVERVKLTDFGLARAADDASLTQSGVVTGTPQYMAPEQARGEAVDHRADLFSLGSVLYAMCTGRPPFRAGTPLAVLRRVAEDTPRPIREVNPDIPAWLAEIIARLQAKDPADRYQTATEAADILGRRLAQLQQPAKATDSRRFEDEEIPPAKRPPRRKTAQRLAVAAVLLLCGGLGLSEAIGFTHVGALLATILRIPTSYGTLLVEVDDPGIQVAVDGDLITIQGAGVQEIRLRPGPHQVKATRDGEPVLSELVTISRGGQRLVRVSLEGRRPADDPGRAAGPGAAPPGGEVRRFAGHAGPIKSVAISSDGRLALSGSGYPDGDRTARVWDLATGREMCQFKGHTGQVMGVAFAPDGRRALSCGTDHTIRIWDVEDGRERRRIKASATLLGLAVSPDGRRALAVGADGGVGLWDIESGAAIRLFKGHTDSVLCAAIAPDGHRALSGGLDGTVRLWDLESGKELRRLRAGGPIQGVAFAPDGRRALSGSDDNTMRLWDLETGAELALYAAEDAVKCVAFSPDGRRVLFGDIGHHVGLVEVGSGEISILEGHADTVWGVAFAPDGRRAVSGGGGVLVNMIKWERGHDWSLRLWQLPDASGGRPNTVAAHTVANEASPTASALAEVRSFSAHRGSAKSVALSADGRRALSGSGYPDGDRSLRLWDVASGRELRRFEADTGQVFGVALSPDGRRALSGGEDPTVRLWDVETGRVVRELRGHPAKVNAVAFFPDGRRALSAGFGDNIIRIWDLETGEALRGLEGHTAPVYSAAVSPDGRWILSGGEDRTIRLWDVTTGKEIRRFAGPTRFVEAVAFSPDGRLALAGGYDAVAWIWDAATGRELARLEGHRGMVADVAFTPDGRRALTVVGPQHEPEEGGSLRIWDVASGRLIAQAAPEGGRGLWSVAASPDGREALTGGSDGRLRLWRLAPAGATPAATAREFVGEIRRFDGHQGHIEAIAVTGDGRRALSACKDRTLRLWDLPTGRELRRLDGHEAEVSDAAVSADGRLAASASLDRTVRIWDLESGRERRRLTGHGVKVRAVALSPDARLILSGAEETPVRLWDAATGKELRRLTGHTMGICRVAFSPDGRRALSGSVDGTARLWDVETGSELRTLVRGQAWVTAVAFLPDGRRALTGLSDGGVSLWDLESGSELGRFAGLGGAVRTVAASADGRLVLAAGTGSLRLFDLADGRPVYSLGGVGGGIVTAALLPDARHVVLGCYNAAIQLWRLPDGLTGGPR